MTRDEYIEIRNKPIGKVDAMDLLYNYCIHRGKTEEESQNIKYVALDSVTFVDWVDYAIDYLDREFEVNILSKNNKIILIY